MKILIAAALMLLISAPALACKTPVYEVVNLEPEHVEGKRVCVYQSLGTGKQIYWPFGDAKATSHDRCLMFLWAADFE